MAPPKPYRVLPWPAEICGCTCVVVITRLSLQAVLLQTLEVVDPSQKFAYLCQEVCESSACICHASTVAQQQGLSWAPGFAKPLTIAQVHHDLKNNRFIQAWFAHGAAGWRLEGECEPDVSIGLGTITILGDNWCEAPLLALHVWSGVTEMLPGRLALQMYARE